MYLIVNVNIYIYIYICMPLYTNITTKINVYSHTM